MKQDRTFRLLVGIAIVTFIAVGAIVAAIVSSSCSSNTTTSKSEKTPVVEENNLSEKTSGTEPITITVSAAGDCVLGTDPDYESSRSFNSKYQEVQDPAYFFANVKDIFAKDDLTIVNFEGTLTDSTDRQQKSFTFKGDPKYVQILLDGNVEAASLANNHSFDFGEQGFNDTKKTLEDAGIKTFGYDDIAFFDIKGVKVALIGILEFQHGMEVQDQLIENLKKADEEGSQLKIVYFHWGRENQEEPTENQIKLGRIAIDNGANLVLGAHPHIIQGYEKYKDSYIAYSLGNFCYGGHTNPPEHEVLIFQQTFTFSPDGTLLPDDAIKPIACMVSSDPSLNNYQPTPATGEKKDAFDTLLQKRSDMIPPLVDKVIGSSREANE